MKVELIDQTPRYRFEKVDGEGSRTFEIGDEVRTFFLHKGELSLEINSQEGLENHALLAGQGFIVCPWTKYKLDGNSFLALQSSSYVGSGPIIEISDLGDRKEERPISGHKIITSPKRINKPWGHELWISWFRDYHVLKQIGMTAGKFSSLQLHRNKLETNYLVEGEADVIDQYPIDLSLTEEKMKEIVKNINWINYTEKKKPNMYWTSKPGIVHRVISRADYIAYETSTPELDDVIRLSDISGRQSGRIISEHLR